MGAETCRLVDICRNIDNCTTLFCNVGITKSFITSNKSLSLLTLSLHSYRRNCLYSPTQLLPSDLSKYKIFLTSPPASTSSAKSNKVLRFLAVFSLDVTCNNLESSIVPADSDSLLKINIYFRSLLFLPTIGMSCLTERTDLKIKKQI